MKKIDLVYLWVDGNDAKWRGEKDKWLRKIQGEKAVFADAVTAARWRDNDELRYSLRSVDKFAPWINHIFIVTGFGQVPDWLDTNNPKITIVPHSVIIPPDALPTFNATAIEMCVMNIPGLSEHFLLANDDTFFGRPVAPDLFYDRRGRAIVYYSKNENILRNFGLWLEKLSGYGQGIAMTAKFFRDIFGRDYKDKRPGHNIDPYIKSSMIVARNHPMAVVQIDTQIRNKFRTTSEIHRWFFSLYDHFHNRAVLRRVRNRKSSRNFIYNLWYRRSIAKSPLYCEDARYIEWHNPPLFCINDTNDSDDALRASNKRILQKMFPEKSRFEI